MKKQTVLETLAQAARIRTEQHKIRLPESRLEQLTNTAPRHLPPFAFEQALCTGRLAVIAEVKKASPSKGIIDETFPYGDIARDYEAAGADCISVLTEPTQFLGSDSYLREIAALVQIPVLRKDFVVDPYMIREARLLGADAVLLIVSLLTDRQLSDCIKLADSLGLSALVECHDAEEITRAVQSGARIIGVNNRDLKTFSVDMANARNLADLIPPDVLFVSESGIRTPADVTAAAEFADAVLVGETLMRAEDKGKTLTWLTGSVAAGPGRSCQREGKGNGICR
ncbi:indole-3-glycerol phosphate synthase TrpC [uncultured Faecalibaculum sp.]|uniref:indole-3-glycerol phosphate synthase TrpC n=1 Tax=uncultured Faecalibaculum sp. TaxID=1729681 RepID=UPI0026256292|nr:indole-3-glycerol phosphate synthase TrpC [uncultured Faecalibaculum sp.]